MYQSYPPSQCFPPLGPPSFGALAQRPTGAVSPTVSAFYSLAATAGMAAGAYHGYKRHGGSVGWAIGWGLLGALFWPIAMPVAAAQGFGKRA